MPTVRAKFKVRHVSRNSDGTAQIQLQLVIGGSAENDSFYKYTPSGSIELSTINEDAAKAFVEDKEYYVDFAPAD